MRDLWRPRKGVRENDDAVNCRLLLIEIIRRASFDWVQYRGSRRMEHRMLAHSAYVWLFMEQPNTPMWRTRELEERQVTSFNYICQAIGADADQLRGIIRRMTVHDVKRVDRFQLDRAIR